MFYKITLNNQSRKERKMLQEGQEPENGQEGIERSEQKPFEFLVNAVLTIEKLRVAAQVRQTHLTLRGRQDDETDELLVRIKNLEDYADGRVAALIQGHPAYHWFSRVKGVGRENIGKVIGLIDINKANSVSALWQFAGYGVVDGKAPKRVKGGGTLSYNSQLRTMCWRLGGSLMKSSGCFYDFYAEEKAKYLQRYEHRGIKIVPASKLPKQNGKCYEPEDIISEGHVHNQALRKMIKLFLACLWLVWREAEGLPTRAPYSAEYLGHTHIISPWDMVDREEKKQKVAAAG
ncbi:MAG: hypothetical protein WC638_03215 [Candidatus Paceibacterota bacterium]